MSEKTLNPDINLAEWMNNVDDDDFYLYEKLSRIYLEADALFDSVSDGTTSDPGLVVTNTMAEINRACLNILYQRILAFLHEEGYNIVKK